MKKPGNTSDFKEHRDRDLHRSFMEVLRTSADTPLRDMFALAAQRPASRFWVSEGRAAIVIGAMRRGVPLSKRMLPQRRRMYQEIFSRVDLKMLARPGLCMTHAVAETVYEPAPEFYISAHGARNIIYQYHKRRRAARCR